MRRDTIETIAGTTLRLTWVCSGATPDSLQVNLLDRSETVVASVAPVSSGNGHYFAPVYVPASGPQWYVARSVAVIGVNTYTDRAMVRALGMEVD